MGWGYFSQRKQNWSRPIEEMPSLSEKYELWIIDVDSKALVIG